MGYLLVFPAPSLFNSLPPSKADAFKASQGCFLFDSSHKEPEYTFNSLYQNETKMSACIQDAEEPVFPRKGFRDSIILSPWVFRVAATNSLRELNKKKKIPFWTHVLLTRFRLLQCLSVFRFSTWQMHLGSLNVLASIIGVIFPLGPACPSPPVQLWCSFLGDTSPWSFGLALNYPVILITFAASSSFKPPKGTYNFCLLCSQLRCQLIE